MKTLKHVKEESGFPSLVGAVIRRIGKHRIEDVINHGADQGVPGFIYYHETKAFFKQYKKDILTLAANTAESLGEDMLSMIARFRCLNGDFTPFEISKAIHGNEKYAYLVRNALAWFVLEEVCRMFED